MSKIITTDLQAKFIHSIVYDGVSGSEAARRAGYSPVSARQTASQLLAQESIQASIRNEQFKYLNGTLASKALKTLEQIIDDETAPHGARVQASIAILERSGLTHEVEAKRLESSTKPVHEMNRSELESFIAATKLVIAKYEDEQTTKVVEQV